jgi:hypothetical protein
MLQAGGCDLLWAPDVATMYPDGHATRIRVAGVSEPLEGASRPGHFDGVATGGRQAVQPGFAGRRPCSAKRTSSSWR